MTTDTFRTSDGQVVKGAQLQDAANRAADKWEANARALRNSTTDWPSHVTEADKDAWLARDLETVRKLRACELNNFTLWQRVNDELTGECVPFLKTRGAA